MAEPKLFKLRERVNCQGYEAYIITIQRGTRHSDLRKDGIYYGVSYNPEDRYPAFTVHQSQVWPITEQNEVHLKLVKS